LRAEELQLLGTVIGRRSRRTTIGKATKNCTNFGKIGKKTCTKVMALRPLIASAVKAESLKSEIAALDRKIPTLAKYGKTQSDPQAYAIATLTGFRQAQVSLFMTLLLTGMLEFVSAFGLTMILAFWHSFGLVVPDVVKQETAPAKNQGTKTKKKSSDKQDNKKAPKIIGNDNRPEDEPEISPRPKRRTKTAARKPRPKPAPEAVIQATTPKPQQMIQTVQEKPVVRPQDRPLMANYLERYIDRTEGVFMPAEVLYEDYSVYMEANRQEAPPRVGFVDDLVTVFGLVFEEREDGLQGFTGIALSDTVVSLNS
jgi:hypothetical protein